MRQRPDPPGRPGATPAATTTPSRRRGQPAAGRRPGRARSCSSGAIPGSNGRSCATCHVLAEDTTLRPASVSARLPANPDDPLFNRLDADDPDAAGADLRAPEEGPGARGAAAARQHGRHRRRGQRGHPARPQDLRLARGPHRGQHRLHRALPVRRARAHAAGAGARRAITSHSEGPEVPPQRLDRVADFQRGIFTSPRARFVSRAARPRACPLEQDPRARGLHAADRAGAARPRGLQDRLPGLPRLGHHRPHRQPRGARLLLRGAQARRQRALRGGARRGPGAGARSRAPTSRS